MNLSGKRGGEGKVKKDEGGRSRSALKEGERRRTIETGGGGETEKKEKKRSYRERETEKEEERVNAWTCIKCLLRGPKKAASTK